MSRFSFAANLSSTLLSPSPPTIAWFKTLPTKAKDLWGVYVIVLEKSGCRPRIYIGSSTGMANGIATRLRDYTYRERMPLYVGMSVDKGYTITHKGLLCWLNTPPPVLRLPTRSLILLLECTFSLVLWAMHSREKTYGMPNLLSWSVDAFQYDGCCGHVCIWELIQGEDEGLTAAQIAAKEAAMDIRRKEQDKEARLRYYAKRNAADFEGWRMRKNVQIKKSNEKVKASGKWACRPCDLKFHSKSALDRHKKRASHISKVTGVKVYKHPTEKRRADRVKAAKEHHCSACNSSLASASALSKHENGPRHLKKVSEASS